MAFFISYTAHTTGSTMNIPYLDDFTAQEALDFALNHDDTPEADAGTPGFETAVLSKCLHRFQILPEARIAFADDVRQTMQPLAGLAITNEIMADTARKIAALLIHYANLETHNANETVMAAIQITTALFSLMKKHTLFEKRCRALQEIAIHGISTHKIQSLLTIAEPTSHDELSQLRMNRENISPKCPDRLDLGTIESWFMTGQIPDIDFLLHYQSLTPQIINENIQILPNYVSIFLQAPTDWLYAQYLQMNAPAKHAIWLIISKKRLLKNLPEIEESFFESWLRNEAANIQAAKLWLDHRLPQTHGSLSRVLTALYKHESGDPDWYGGWLRDVDSEFPANNDALWENTPMSWNDFETFWHAEAWRCANSRQKAIAMLQERLSIGSESPQLWLILADILIDVQNFGLAEHAIEQSVALSYDNDDRIPKAIEIIRHRLGKKALKSAKQAHDIEPALLELAMKHGDPNTISEAALCAFDAACEPIDVLATILANSPQSRLIFIEKLAERRDLEHLDESYKLCQTLETLCPNAPEIRFLEAVCQLDNPPTAAQTLEHALRHLDNTQTLYWTAVDLWIELMASQNAWYEAVSGIAQAFASPHPRAVRSLMFLIACLPRDARPMMQSVLFENLGPEQTREIFDRARNPQTQPKNPPLPTLSIQDLALSMMPVAWQMLHRTARLNPPPTPEDSARAARRESILAAHGLASSKYENAPEPAAWVHTTLSKASDAFDK